MQFKIAELSDIDATLKLHAQYQIDHIKEEDKADGFVTTAFTKEELTQLINQEQGLFIAKNEEVVLGFGLLEVLFEMPRVEMAKRYPILITLYTSSQVKKKYDKLSTLTHF